MDSKELNKILNKHMKWLHGKDKGERAYLRSAYLSGADLSSADLRSADLRDAYLRSADLKSAYLRDADLRSADLRGADLRSADLRGAYLSGADLKSAHLSGADLKSADLSGAYLGDADLSSADLSGAYLRGADLSSADLRSAYLRSADLSSADLSGADLRDAYLRSADLRSADLSDTIYDGVNWLLLLGIVPDSQGKARAYKVTNSDGEGIYQGGINYTTKDKFSVPKVDKDLNTQCSFGINLATLAWCFTIYDSSHRLFLMEFDAKDAVCPIGSDGKFRVKKCVKIGECNWKGELLK